MRKLSIPILALSGILITTQSIAQNITASTPWVWMAGDSTINQSGHYGTKNVPSQNNIPGSRKQAASWTDDAGNFWLFGGRKEASNVTAAVYNDLWKYTPSTKEWTWVSGDSIPFLAAAGTGQGAVIGTQGVPSTNNTPGARSLANYWNDNNGNFWIQGGGAGNGGSKYNDLWKFNVINKTWTWIRGNTAPTIDQPGIYGTMGVAAATNQPGSRIKGACWADNNGFLWLFGGQGVFTTSSASSSGMGDLWKYEIATDLWTWVSGSTLSAATNQTANYGTMGVAAATNKPGGRMWPITWVDTGNNLWMLGGLGYTATTSQGVLSDLWKYNTVTNQWVWMNGSSTINHQGTYISQGVAGGNRMPRGRFGSTGWVDKAGDFWLFGGVTIAWQNLTLNDIWKYEKATNEWTWVKGDSIHNIQPVYNTLQVPNPLNEVGSRGVDMSWRERNNNNIWVFGGYCMQGTSIMVERNDLWKIETCTPTGNVSSISGQDTVCAGDTVTFSVAPVQGAFSYNWSVPAGWTILNSSYTLQAIAVNTGGAITLSVLGQCGDSSSLQTHNVFSSTLQQPVISVSISNGVASLSLNGSYAAYQWYQNGTPISGANAATYVTSSPGNYSVEVTSAGGCTAMSAVENITSVSVDGILGNDKFMKLFPNPSNGNTIQVDAIENGTIRILDIQGRTVYQQKIVRGSNTLALDALAKDI
ncbi:MAG TPA: kelch repeat-containing protein [Edaphocola sp.]|nr:kelch repeat-containing protein [Edaphocola sp.]